jgi:hypothetical protein
LRYGVRFLERHNEGGRLFIELPAFPSVRHIVKEEFLRRMIFPLNNEQVSHAHRLAADVGVPLIAALRRDGLDPTAALQEMTDQTALDAAVERGLIQDATPYMPLLPSGSSPLLS